VKCEIRGMANGGYSSLFLASAMNRMKRSTGLIFWRSRVRNLLTFGIVVLWILAPLDR
jgi:hypothetical protein